MKRISMLAALFVLIGGMSAFGGTLVPVYDNATGDLGNQAWTGNLAELFTVNSTITVVALGAFDNGSATLNSPITVGIASISGGVGTAVPNASYTFAAGLYTDVVGGDVFYTLPTPVTLTPGTYEVDAFGWALNQLDGDTNCDFTSAYGCQATLSNSPAFNSLGGSVTADGGAYSLTVGTLDYPTGNTQGSALSIGTFAVETPEPGSLLLLGTGLLGLAFVAFRQVKASRLA